MLRHFRADHSYKAMNNNIEIATVNENITMICVDVQQVLFCSALTHSCMYYKCQLSTYNFNIHDMGRNKVNFYLWNETIEKRGSTEMSSCLLRYMTENFRPNSSQFRKPIVWLHRSMGQTNSWQNFSLFRNFVTSGHFWLGSSKMYFLAHNFLPCDRDFTLIFKKIKMFLLPCPFWMDVRAKRIFASRSFQTWA